MNIAENYKLLKWDSNYFGFNVASILNDRYDSSSLAAILRDLKRKNYRLIYWGSDYNDADSQKAAKDNDGFLADKKTIFTRDLIKGEIFSLIEEKEIVEYTLDYPTNELINLGYLSGQYSRFNIDKNISKEKFEGLYKLWVINSVNKKIADTIYVKYLEGKVAAMMTLQKKTDSGIIGLIAVDRILQGMNIGTALVLKALNWSKEQGCKNAKVVTQLDNLPACGLYEKCGYKIDKIESFYHFWI